MRRKVIAAFGLWMGEGRSARRRANFPSFRIARKRKRGTGNRHIDSLSADRPLRSVKARIPTLTNRKPQQTQGPCQSGSPRSTIRPLG